jgi:arylsulfotransferase ASST
LAAAAGGVAAVSFPRAAPAATEATRGFATFVSEPALRPPTLTVLTRSAPAAGLLFVTTLNGPGQRGPLIVDDHGRVVWFKPVSDTAIDFRVQRYKGKPVLTWWEGQVSQTGVGQGIGVIVDSTYAEIARVSAGNGLQADVHEFLLTPNDTALITVYNPVDVDLTAVGGPASHKTFDSIVQEIDVASGAVLFEWHSLDHIPVTDSYAPILDPFDYFHINSIDIDLDGNLLVSARNTSAIYKLDRSTGRVMWRLGGRSSDFTLGPGVFFMYQHDARGHADGTLTLFDDGPGPSSEQARALRLGLDLAAKHAIVLQEYVHPQALQVAAMGNAQVQPDDGVLVGWGTQPYVTEFGAGGDVRFDAKFDGDAWNYRAFRNAWAGTPKAPPSVAVRRFVGKTVVYASWNGSTQTAFWRVEANGAAKTVPTQGFETAIELSGAAAKSVTVSALDARRRQLAQRVVAVAH